MKNLKRKLFKFVIVLIGLYIMIASALYFLQEKLLFFPTVLEPSYQYQFHHNFEELFLETADNSTINALHFKTEEDKPRAIKPKGVFSIFTGMLGI